MSDSATLARESSTQQIEAVLDQAAALGCMQVRFTGGEPLLRDDFEDLYVYARRLGMKVLVFTNARRITPHVADLLARVPPLVALEVSVYGMHATSYEAVSRVPGSFAQFRRGVDLLLDRGVPFIVKAALLPPNRKEMREFEAWAADIPWMTKPPTYAMFFDLRIRRDDARKDRLIRSLRVSPSDGVAVLTRDAHQYRKEMTEFGSRFMGPSGDVLFPCGAGQALSVDAYGRAQACMGLRARDFTIDVVGLQSGGGSREAGGPQDVGGAMTLAVALDRFRSLSELRAATPAYLRRCARCFLKGLCEQCPAKSWTENATLDTPSEYLCDIAHAQARWMGWLDGDEYGWEVDSWRDRVRQ